MTADITQPVAVALTTESLTQTATTLREWQWPIAQDAADLLDAAAVKLDASEAALAAAERERDWHRDESARLRTLCHWVAEAAYYEPRREDIHAKACEAWDRPITTPAPTPSGGEQP